MELQNGANEARQIEAQREAISNDGTIDIKEKRRRLSRVKKQAKNDTDRCSGWWGKDGVNMVFMAGNEAIDLGVGRLEPFDPAWISTYPTFKDPSKDFEPGVSLCKLGFPFHHIKPSWNGVEQRFELPPGSLPLPFFPIDGIFTRMIEIVIQGAPQPAEPLKLIETSSPGLKGQSGGPIFDAQGTIWGIQVHTAHYPLGFNPPVPGGAPGAREHQFINVGRGVHPDTMFAVFKQLGVKFQVSAY